jgi:hypothetical protein
MAGANKKPRKSRAGQVLADVYGKTQPGQKPIPRPASGLAKSQPGRRPNASR